MMPKHIFINWEHDALMRCLKNPYYTYASKGILACAVQDSQWGSHRAVWANIPAYTLRCLDARLSNSLISSASPLS